MARPTSIAHASKSARKRAGRRAGFNPDEIVELRTKIGQLVGRKMASRELTAKILGASPGSIFNWERGTAPNTLYVEKIRRVRAEADAGTLDVTGNRAGMGRNGAYANDVVVKKNGEELWLHFQLKGPHGKPTTIAEVVIPRALVKRMK